MRNRTGTTIRAPMAANRKGAVRLVLRGLDPCVLLRPALPQAVPLLYQQAGQGRGDLPRVPRHQLTDAAPVLPTAQQHPHIQMGKGCM